MLKDYATYLHRVGRTGRFGRHGNAISLVDGGSVVLLRKIEEHFGCTLTELRESDLGALGEILKLPEDPRD